MNKKSEVQVVLYKYYLQNGCVFLSFPLLLLFFCIYISVVQRLAKASRICKM